MEVKPQFLYHGSTRKLCGELLIPAKYPFGTRPENSLHAVYATSSKRVSIIWSLLRGHGGRFVRNLDDDDNPIEIYAECNKPLNTSMPIWIYTLPPESFQEMGEFAWTYQYASFTPVRPIITENFLVKDIMDMGRFTI